MSGFQQNIDLLAQLEPEQAKPQSLIYMSLLWGFVIVGYLATSFVLSNQESDLQQQVKEAQQRNQHLQRQISQSQRIDEAIDLTPLESQLETLRLEQQRQQLLLDYLSESRLQSSYFFSDAMAGLARQHVPGISIEQFSYQKAGQISIKGQLGHPQALPRYVKNLGFEPAFHDVSFNKVVMVTSEETLSFEMSSSKPAERGS